MTDTKAIFVVSALLVCVAVIDANFGANGALFNGCVIGIFFGWVVDSHIKKQDRCHDD